MSINHLPTADGSFHDKPTADVVAEQCCRSNQVLSVRKSLCRSERCRRLSGPRPQGADRIKRHSAYRAKVALAEGLSLSRGLRLFSRLYRFEVHCGCFPAAVILKVIGQALILAEAAHPGALHSGDVNERVIAALVGLDETVALVLIEKFDGADRHFRIPSVGAPNTGA
jgi:hypothetical protein